MDQPGLDFLWPAAARRASALPPLPGSGNATLWDDICDTLLDPEPDLRTAETIQRWLREQVEQDLRRRLKQGNARHLVTWACQLAPQMAWKLPPTSGAPPPRSHRRIVSILLPHKLRQLERELARLAFTWQFHPVPAPPAGGANEEDDDGLGSGGTGP